jgi:hypothetical protein
MSCSSHILYKLFFILQLVDENQIFADKNDNILDDLLILSCEEDFAICRHFLKRGFESFHLVNEQRSCVLTFIHVTYEKT